jgi:hypothetical protein
MTLKIHVTVLGVLHRAVWQSEINYTMKMKRVIPPKYCYRVTGCAV